MFMADITIKLAGKEFKIGGLTIRQARDLRIGDATIVPKGIDGAFWTDLYDLCVKTVAIAIRETHPDVTEDELWKMKATEEEFAAARREILIHAGFRAAEPTIAELRSQVTTLKMELEQLEKTLTQREAKAKETGEG
jgi:hypothetical protein